MSTFTGQSPLHPLQDRHRSSASKTSWLFQPSRITSPCIISKRRWARPRVECFFFHGRAVTRAHGALFLTPAFADTDAAHRGMREAALVVDEMKMRRGFLGRKVRPEAKILGDRIRIDDLARIHLSFRVPDALEFAKRLADLCSEHLRQELGFRLSVAVLARERSAVFDDQRGRVVHERAIVRDTFGGQQIERDPGMNTALAEMAVEGAFIAMLVVKLAQFAQVRADLIGRNRGILPALPGHMLARNPGGRAQAGLADFPDEMLFVRVVVELHRGSVGVFLQGCPSDGAPGCRNPFCPRRRIPRAASRGHRAGV